MALELKNLEARALAFWAISNDNAAELWPLIASFSDKRFDFLPNKLPEIRAVLDLDWKEPM